MSTRTIELAVGRHPELGMDGRASLGPLAPVEPGGAGAGLQEHAHQPGPPAPATHGVLRWCWKLDGETVVRCIPHIGYLHSSFEKLGEYRTYNQIVPLTDRMDYLAPLIYNCAYAMAVEKLMGIEVTERCRIVRIICMELDRIFSHLLWLGTTAIDVGAFTPFLYAFQQREQIYRLHEALTGARITTSATRVGGMMADIPEGWDRRVSDFLDQFPRTLDEIDSLLTTNAIHLGRTLGVGVISAEDAVNCGFTGPNLRASGVPYDIRKDRPYYGYETFDFEVRWGSTGTATIATWCGWRRCGRAWESFGRRWHASRRAPSMVEDPRISLPSKTDCMNDMESMIHHFKLIMEGIPAPPGDCYFSVEGSKGELGDVPGGGRWTQAGALAHPPPPSFVNLSVLPKLVEGGMLSDAIMVNASLDIVLGEIDR